MNFQDELEQLKVQYEVLYWFTIVLGVALYWLEYYNINGYFNIQDKIVDTTRMLAVDYALMAVVGIIFLGVLVGSDSVPAESDALTVTVISLANSYGEGPLSACLPRPALRIFRTLPVSAPNTNVPRSVPSAQAGPAVCSRSRMSSPSSPHSLHCPCPRSC